MSLFYPYSHHHHQRLGSLVNRSYHPFGSYFRQQSPFSSLDDTTRQLTTWMDQTHHTLSSTLSNSRSSSTPSFAVEDAENAYIIEGSVPGIHEDDISVHIVDNTTLTVRGQTETIQKEDSAPSHPETQPTQNRIATTSGENSPANTDQAIHPNTQTLTPEASQDITTSPADQALQHRNTTPPTKPSPRYRMTQRSISQFQRTFKLPDGIDRTRITTEFAEGRLRITVPKPNTDTNTEMAEAGLKSRGVDLEIESQAPVEGRDHHDHGSNESKREHGTLGRDESESGIESGIESEVTVANENQNESTNDNSKAKPKPKARKVEIEVVDDEDA